MNTAGGQERMKADCAVPDCDGRGAIRLLNNDSGFRRYCLEHASEANRSGEWRDACGDLHRAREYQRDLLMLREVKSA